MKMLLKFRTEDMDVVLTILETRDALSMLDEDKKVLKSIDNEKFTYILFNNMTNISMGYFERALENKDIIFQKIL